MLRIAITGPESTGKSWLAEQLAEYYGTVWAPEFAREFLEKSEGKYNFDDILKIAEGQLHNEEKGVLDASGILFCDTDFIVTRIWSEVKFQSVHPWILEQVYNHRYDLYLLCNTDLPWEYDPLREHPEMRDELFKRYETVLKEIHANYKIVSNLGEMRKQNAIRFIEDLLSGQL